MFHGPSSNGKGDRPRPKSKDVRDEDIEEVYRSLREDKTKFIFKDVIFINKTDKYKK